MTTNWRAYCGGDDRLRIDGDAVVVAFEDGRSHRVEIAEAAATLELSAVVARKSRLRDVEDLEIRVWRSNRLARLNGFRIDRVGKLCAYGWLPKAGLTAEEFRFVVHRVAIESDRLEFVLTGVDVE